MKYIKLFEDIVSWGDNKPKMGAEIPSDDEHLILMNDLLLELKDDGFRVRFKGYYAYHDGYICYDIFVENSDSYEIFDITKPEDINIDLTKIQQLTSSMKDILARLIDNGLYLGSHSINMKDDGLYSHSRLFKRIDGEDMDSEFTYGGSVE